jgi:hypothetical protein
MQEFYIKAVKATGLAQVSTQLFQNAAPGVSASNPSPGVVQWTSVPGFSYGVSLLLGGYGNFGPQLPGVTINWGTASGQLNGPATTIDSKADPSSFFNTTNLSIELKYGTWYTSVNAADSLTAGRFIQIVNQEPSQPFLLFNPFPGPLQVPSGTLGEIITGTPPLLNFNPMSSIATIPSNGEAVIFPSPGTSASGVISLIYMGK